MSSLGSNTSGQETVDAGVETPEELPALSSQSEAMASSVGGRPSPPNSSALISASGEIGAELSPFDSQSTEGASYLSLSSLEEINSKIDQDEGAPILTGDPLIGMFINNLQILSRLGSGGFGAVYLAEHTELQTPFAIKILNIFQSNRAEVVERFRREARAIALLNHPHIVKIADFGWLDGYGYYLVMEYLQGRNLRELLDHWDSSQGGLPIIQVRSWIQQLCGALGLVHHKGIVHRDLKPSNIVLVHDPKGAEIVKLIDFGIAAINDDESLTASGVCMGSPAYMSPEQAEGQSHALDARSDLYSLGVILYQLLTGKLPFEGRGLASFVRMHLLEPPPPLHKRCPQIKWHPAMEELLQRVLAKEPDQRPPDIEAFWQECAIAFDAQAEFNAMTPVVETHILPSPKRQRSDQSDTFVVPSPSRSDLSSEKTVAMSSGVTVALPTAPAHDSALEQTLGGAVLPDDPDVLHEAADDPAILPLAFASAGSSWAWIAMLLGFAILCAGLGAWWLMSTPGQAPATMQPRRTIPGALPRARSLALPVPRSIPRPANASARPQPRQAATTVPPRLPSDSAQRRPPPRQIKATRRRRRRRYRRRRRRYRRKRRLKRRRRYRRRPKPRGRDVFGFEKDPV